MKPKDLYPNLSTKIDEKTTVFSLLIFFIILVYYNVIFYFSANIPQLDDFDAILGFANKFFDSTSVLGKIQLLFSQHNEHRIVLSRIFTLLSYYATDSIDFKLLNFIGNLGLLGLLMVFFISAKASSQQLKLLYLIPAAFFLFQPGYGMSMLVAMASISNLFVLFFASLSLFLLTKNSRPLFLLALGAALAATFTNGNGLLVFPVGLISLIYQRQYKKSLTWFLLAAFSVLFYFTGYTQPLHQTDPLGTLVRHPGYFANFFLAALNPFNCIYLNKALFFKIGPGLILFSAFLYFGAVKYHKKNMALFSILSYLFLSVTVLAFNRSTFAPELAFDRRYSILSILILITLYLAVMEHIGDKTKQWFFPLFLILSISFNLYSYGIGFPVMSQNKAKLSLIIKTWNHRKGVNSYLAFYDQKLGHSILTTAIEKKLYAPPAQ